MSEAAVLEYLGFLFGAFVIGYGLGVGWRVFRQFIEKAT